MKNFTNITSSGNERALRRGTRVPDGDVNLSWVKSPKLSSENNVIILDTSRTIEENRVDYSTSTHLMYANSLGILEDENGNQIVEDEYPCIADVFLQDEDFLTVVGNEYTDDDPLPLVHISRYFHLDFEGLAIGNNVESFNSELVQVVTKSGEPLTSKEGEPLYRVRLTSAYSDVDAGSIDSKTGVYRLWVFLPANLKKDYFLKYNKVELSTSGKVINPVSSHKEIVNPVSYFNYVPEESDVVDPSNRRRKIYSTKPVTKKSVSAGKNVKDVEGYKVYVPRKAIADPRLYQLTRWRVKCEFTQDYEVSSIGEFDSLESVNVGFITTNDSSASNGAFMFVNLENSFVNKSNVSFTNPYSSSPFSDHTDADYWNVNFDTITESQLLDYDLLVLSPNDPHFDFESIVNKIDYFVNVGNGTLLVDTNGESTIENSGIATSTPVDAVTGGSIGLGSETYPLDHGTLAASDAQSTVIKGSDYLGGYNLDSEDYDFLSLKASGAYGRYSHYINSYPSDYNVIISGDRTNGQNKGMLIGRTRVGIPGTRKGKVYFSALGLPQTCSAFVNSSGSVVNDNDDIDTIVTDSGWPVYINSEYVVSAMKLVYNIVLSSTENKFIEEDDESSFSSKWAVFSDWKSTWAIDGAVLSADERSRNDFVFQPKNPTGDTDVVWQRRLSDRNLKQIIDSVLTESMKLRLANSSRTYSIEVTNTNIGTPTILEDNTIPRIWSEMYSPTLKVPQDFGPHIIKSEPFEPEYSSGQYEAISYPAKKYALQAQRSFIVNSEGIESQTSNYQVNINYTKVIELDNATDAVYAPIVEEPRTEKDTITWTSVRPGGGVYAAMSNNPWSGTERPSGMTTYQEKNYYSPNLGNWPYWGARGIYSIGSRGEIISFIQSALNQFIFFGVIAGPGLAEDGYYGSRTASAVRRLQDAKDAFYKDSVVGAETFAIIGFGIKGLEQLLNSLESGSGTRLYRQELPSQASYKALFRAASLRCDFINISNDPNDPNPFAKISWTSGGPSIIRDYFTVIFDQSYELSNVIVTPFLEGSEDTCLIESLHLENNINSLVGWDPSVSFKKYSGLRVRNGVPKVLDFEPRIARQITVGMAQDRQAGTGYGSARMFGIKNIEATVLNRYTVTTGGGLISSATENEIIRRANQVEPVSGSEVIDPAKPVTVNLRSFIPSFQDEIDSDEAIADIRLEDISFEFVSQDNPAVIANLTRDGRLQLSTNYQVDGTFSYIQQGDELSEDSSIEYFSMTPSGNVSIANETGFVSTDEGVKLLCDSAGKPVGIPSNLATNSFSYIEGEISSVSSQLELRSLGTEQNVFYGFYDINQKTFINEASGNRIIISDDTVKSIGLDNIYIAVVSRAGAVTETVDLPEAQDAPPLPRLWAMPVYGICYKSNSRIGIDPLPKNLGPMDVWSIPIRVGSFDKRTYIKPRSEQSLTHWSKAYEGKTLHAFYGVPEAKNSGWSLLYGRPNIDVKDEVPDLISTTAIRVRQAPILTVTEPYQTSSYADPLRPVFKVYTRDSIADPWVEMSLSNIADYDISDGTIYFRTPLNSSDPNMVKVSYTSSRKVYDFRQYNGSNRINLNPYILKDESLINKAIYVYIIPEYVYDENGSLITESVSSSTVRWTTDPGIFDALDSAVYNPLAIKLGIVYITNTADIENLVMVDTRLRGGGVYEYENDAELKQNYEYMQNYWDINYGSGEAYQSGGFAIIRLPSELKTRFDDDDRLIIQSILRNLPAGVAYELQDLNGNPWR